MLISFWSDSFHVFSRLRKWCFSFRGQNGKLNDFGFPTSDSCKLTSKAYPVSDSCLVLRTSPRPYLSSNFVTNQGHKFFLSLYRKKFSISETTYLAPLVPDIPALISFSNVRKSFQLLYCILFCFCFFCLAPQVPLGKGTKLIKKCLCSLSNVWKLQLCQLLMSFQLYFYPRLKIQLSCKNQNSVHVCSLFPSLRIFPVSFRWYSLFCSCLHCFVIVFFVMKFFNQIGKNFEKKIVLFSPNFFVFG